MRNLYTAAILFDSPTYKEERVIKTYDWISATALSKTNRAASGINTIAIILILAPGRLEVTKVINKCPATILAANRTDKVIGRIILLTISISTINGIKTPGVPKGTKCAKKDLKSKTTELAITAIHIGSAIVKVKVRWADEVNTYGNKPATLILPNIKNNPIKLFLI